MNQHRKQPFVTTAGTSPRRFVASPVALQAVVVNQREEVVLLSSPSRRLGWQTVSGGMEAGETVLDGTQREIQEELGPAVQVRPLGPIHVESFHYDQNVRYMIAIYTLFEYLGGDIIPGDDMVGSAVRWWTIEALRQTAEPLHPTAKPWVIGRAIDLYRLWKDQDGILLQPTI